VLVIMFGLVNRRYMHLYSRKYTKVNGIRKWQYLINVTFLLNAKELVCNTNNGNSETVLATTTSLISQNIQMPALTMFALLLYLFIHLVDPVCCHLSVVGGLRTSMTRIVMLAGVFILFPPFPCFTRPYITYLRWLDVKPLSLSLSHSVSNWGYFNEM